MPFLVPRSMWASDLNLAEPRLLHLHDGMLVTMGTSCKQQNIQESAQDAGNKGLKATVELRGCEDKKEAAGLLQSSRVGVRDATTRMRGGPGTLNQMRMQRLGAQRLS